MRVTKTSSLRTAPAPGSCPVSTLWATIWAPRIVTATARTVRALRRGVCRGSPRTRTYTQVRGPETWDGPGWVVLDRFKFSQWRWVFEFWVRLCCQMMERRWAREDTRRTEVSNIDDHVSTARLDCTFLARIWLNNTHCKQSFLARSVEESGVRHLASYDSVSVYSFQRFFQLILRGVLKSHSARFASKLIEMLFIGVKKLSD